MSHRAAEIDPLLALVEAQTEPIDELSLRRGSTLMVDSAKDSKEVSRQSWAMLSPLVHKMVVSGTFVNVKSHNPPLVVWRIFI